ncbi:Pyrroline-5-carboxylate reductase [Alteripontixanthobacter maritimus]|uniref:Pyrroline-5-carboxylate reductase n=2 Tax=Alteripontixanthobacter maritimus TaxID=2161824 RepID=A0A369QAQ8_9SPHN|nr:Pyrroline-5-carboxylate reductase [Alteripontixanthobacter maritimus]
MTQAMVEGWLAGGISPDRFTAYHPTRKQAAHGIAMTNRLEVGTYDTVLLGIKPQMLPELAPQVAPLATGSVTVLSVLAGITLDGLAVHFPNASGVVRLMPNLACGVRKSPIALIGRGMGEPLADDVRQKLTQLAAVLGSAEWIADEGQFDLVTALAGSGPGFTYRFIDALARAAAQLGLPDDQARRLSLAMVEGAVALAAASDVSPADLAARVASPGGMTQRGLDVLDDDDALLSLLTRTLRETRDRGEEMGRTRP